VPPPSPKYSYLHRKNAERVEQLIYVTKWMAVVIGTWVELDPEFLDEDFAPVWTMTRWLCGLQLPETVDDFWTGPPVLERKAAQRPQQNGRNGHTAREGATPSPSLTREAELMGGWQQPQLGGGGKAPAALEGPDLRRGEPTNANRGT
jgi:hypothetical protein